MNIWGMVPAEDIAVAYAKDGTAWGWVIAAAIGLAAVLVAVVAPLVAGFLDDVRGGLIWWILLLLVGLAAAGVLLVLPGIMMRHVEIHANVWWVVIPWMAVAGFFVWWGRSRLWEQDLQWAGYVPAILITAGVAIGAGVDALNRLASWIPTTVGALVALLVIIVIVLVAKARE